jgi:hypothetical protein
MRLSPKEGIETKLFGIAAECQAAAVLECQRQLTTDN